MVLAKPKPTKEVKTKKRHKKTRRQLLEIALDSKAKEIVLMRDEFCVCPPPRNGHSVVRQPGHLISRSKESVKWDLYNLNEQCSSCNLLHEFSPHRYTQWFIERFGLEKYMTLCKDSEEVSKLSIEELEELLGQMTEILRLQLRDEKFRPYFTQKEIISGEWRKL